MGHNTTHYSIADKDGNAVSVLHTERLVWGQVTAAKTGVL